MDVHSVFQIARVLADTSAGGLPIPVPAQYGLLGVFVGAIFYVLWWQFRKLDAKDQAIDNKDAAILPLLQQAAVALSDEAAASRELAAAQREHTSMIRDMMTEMKLTRQFWEDERRRGK